MKKISYIISVAIIITLFTTVQGLAQNKTFIEETWSKYPDNSTMEFNDVDSFYDSLDKNKYVEFENANLNIREQVNFKDINAVLSKGDKFYDGKSRFGGEGYHPKRQVYVFFTVSHDGKKVKKAIFDAETKRAISISSN